MKLTHGDAYRTPNGLARSAYPFSSIEEAVISDSKVMKNLVS
jgi:hypothetical protein